MRPIGEISQVLLSSMATLCTPDQAPTLLELANHAQVGLAPARATLANMTRHGHARIVRTRRVDYRNRPVAEYEPVAAASQGRGDGAGFVDLGMALSAWSR